MPFLTDLNQLSSAVTLNDIIHVVVTGDTTQNPAGSSYRVSMSQVLDLISNEPATFSSGVTASTITIGNTVLESDGGCIKNLCIKETFGATKDIEIAQVKAGRGGGDKASNTTFSSSGMSANTTGEYLTSMGDGALASNTIGNRNTSFGYQALRDNSTGDNNVAIGSEALQSSDASNNIAIGFRALKNSTSSFNSTSIGTDSLFNSNGSYNVAIGHISLTNNTVGVDNTAIGYNSSPNISIANSNVSVGSGSLLNTTIGDGNVGIGNFAGSSNITGQYNVFIGGNADCGVTNLTNAIAIGSGAVVSQSNSMILGNGVNVGINNSAPTSNLHVAGITGYQQFRMESTYTPANTLTPTGNVGEVAWDDNFIYIKTSAGWKRAGLSTF
jgi:hypothetical protein